MDEWKRKGQAALFDGILFLVIVMFSVSMLYAFLTSYGTAQERTLRSSHELNFLQTVVKAIYSVDVSTLGGVPKWEGSPSEVINPAYADLDCNKTKEFKGRFSIAELLKKDLSDFSGTNCGGDQACQSLSKLDDKFGTSDAPGTTALRCALKEYMKPFTYAGMEYMMEVYTQDGPLRVPIMPKDGTGVDMAAISNHPPGAEPKIQSCDDAAQVYSDLLAVRTPFRIRGDIGVLGTPKTYTYTLRLCVWRKPRT